MPPTLAASSNYCRTSLTAARCVTSSRFATTVFARPNSSHSLREHKMPVVFTDHAKYPNIADLTGDFVYARLQRGKDTIPTAYPPKDIAAWAGRLQSWAQGAAPDDLPHVEPAKKAKPAPRDVYAYVIHEGKVRAPAAAMALIERLGKRG